MKLDTIVTGLILIVAFYVMFFVGKWVTDVIHKEFKITKELVHNDNPALALAMVGYYIGLVLAIGGTLVGPSTGIVDSLLDLAIYGALSIILLNISWFVCDKLILYKFKISDELIRDQNQGTGAVSAGVSIATGFILFGSVQGHGGSIWTVLGHWVIGQAILVLAGLIYQRCVRYDLHAEIEKDNVAAGVSFGGAIAAMGVIIGLSAEDDFISWGDALPGFLSYCALGLILLPLVRLATDKVLLPTVRLSDEIAGQEKPNIGAAYIEAFAYIAAAFIIYWCV